MCGGCPGGAGISRLSAYAAVTGIKAGVGAILQQFAGRRLVIRPFGDHWMIRTRNGKQQVLPGLEDVAAVVAAGPLDWAEVEALAGEEISGAMPYLTCPSEAVLQRIAGSPQRDMPEGELSGGQFTAALLVRAVNAGSRRGLLQLPGQ